MKVKENRTVLLVSMFIVIALVILTIMGSYAFYTSVLKTTGDGTGVESTTADLKLEFEDNTSDVNLTNMIPGDSYTKSFTVKNTGSETIKFQVVIREVENTFENKDDVTISVKKDDQNVTIGEVESIKFPENTTPLSDPITIEPSEDAESFEVSITYKNDPTKDQGKDMEKKLGGTIFIEAIP